VTGRYHWILFENLLRGNWLAVAILENKQKKKMMDLYSKVASVGTFLMFFWLFLCKAKSEISAIFAITRSHSQFNRSRNLRQVRLLFIYFVVVVVYQIKLILEMLWRQDLLLKRRHGMPVTTIGETQ